MTLSELIIYCFLMGMLVTAVYSVLVLSQRYLRISQASLDLQAYAQRAVAHLSHDIADSRYSTVTAGSGVVTMLSPRDANDNMVRDASGNLYWQKWIEYYLANGCLVRCESPITPTITPPTTPPDTFPPGTVIAQDVSTFAVGTQPTSQSVSLQIGFSTSVLSPGDTYINAITDAVCPRN